MTRREEAIGRMCELLADGARLAERFPRGGNSMVLLHHVSRCERLAELIERWEGQSDAEWEAAHQPQ